MKNSFVHLILFTALISCNSTSMYAQQSLESSNHHFNQSSNHHFTQSSNHHFTQSSNHHFTQSSNHHFNIEEATIESVHQAMKNGALTCQSLVAAYIDRIRTYNLTVNENPPINAITQINPKVLTEAQKLDEQYRKTQQFVGPLHCIPVVLKDNIDAIDTITSAGSLALIKNYPSTDAELVKRLRKAGAIILVKGAMDEFGWGLFGISSRNGRIGNAYDTRKNPGGSSAGVAAAISANFGMIGIGSDNCGSIRIPAVFNGLNGLRPSTGLVSQNGIFPMGNLDAVAGPITRSIKDLAIVLEIIAAKADSKDPKTKNILREISYHHFLKTDGLKNKRIGIIRSVAGNSTYAEIPQDITQVLDLSIYRMKQLGASFIDVDLNEYIVDREQNQAGEAEDVSDYFKMISDSSKSIVNSNKTSLNFNADSSKNNINSMRTFQDICNSDNTRTFGDKSQCLKFVDTLPRRNSKEYKNVLSIFKKNKQYIESLMQEKQLDALLMAVSSAPSGSYNALKFNTFMLPVASNAGLPALAFIVGYSKEDNMPVGVELIGPSYTEGKLIEMAFSFEQNVKPRKPPNLTPGTIMLQYSIEKMNNLFSRLGKVSYEKVLKNDHRFRLNADRFHEIFMEEINKNR